LQLAFDLTRKHGLLADIHGNKKTRMRQCLDRTTKTSKGAVSLREQSLEFTFKLDWWFWWQPAGGDIIWRFKQEGAAPEPPLPLMEDENEELYPRKYYRLLAGKL